MLEAKRHSSAHPMEEAASSNNLRSCSMSPWNGEGCHFLYRLQTK